MTIITAAASTTIIIITIQLFQKKLLLEKYIIFLIETNKMTFFLGGIDGPELYFQFLDKKSYEPSSYYRTSKKIGGPKLYSRSLPFFL
jgi:hypothetical protein